MRLTWFSVPKIPTLFTSMDNALPGLDSTLDLVNYLFKKKN